MPKNFSDKVADKITGLQVDLLFFETGVRQDIFGMLYRLEDELVDQIRNLKLAGAQRNSTRLRRAELLIKQVRDTIRTAYREPAASLRKEVLELAKFNAEAIPKAWNSAFKVNLVDVFLTPDTLKELSSRAMVYGNPASSYWNRQRASLVNRFAQEIRLGVSAGETNGDLVRRIIGGVDTNVPRVAYTDSNGNKRFRVARQGGIMNATRQQAEALVRTSVQTVSNNVQQETYKQNEDILRGQQALVTLDGRTTFICMGRSGGAWDLEGDPLPESTVDIPFPGPPPWHYGCRTVLMPLTKSWTDLVEEATGKRLNIVESIPNSVRASMDGQVAGDLNYETWLRTKSKAFQIKQLGPKRWAAWQKGKLTTHQLIDTQGKKLTLAQLREKYGIAV